MTTLPVNVDTTYADDPADSSVKAHQQHHDTLHAAYNNPASNWAQGDAAYAPLSLTGTYAARPAASTVITGTLYYATDTLECYRATGTAGVAATSWTVVGSGGTELGYAEITANFSHTAAPNPTVTWWTITGLTTPNVVIGERPILVTAHGDLTFNDLTAGTAVGIFDDLGTQIAQWQVPRPPNTGDQQPFHASRRISTYTAGATRNFTLKALTFVTGDQNTVIAATTAPAYIEVRTV